MTFQTYLAIGMILGWTCVCRAQFEDVARRTLSRNDELRQEYHKSLDKLRAAQGHVEWAEAGFRDMRNVRSPFEGSTTPLDQSLRHQRLALQRLTTLPLNELRHSVTKGAALNRLLDILGPVAAEHEQRMLRMERKGGTPLTEEEQLRSQFQAEFEEGLLLDPVVLNSLVFETGLSGSRGRARIQQVAGKDVQVEQFPLKWPELLRHPKYEFKLKAIERARSRLLADPHPPGTTESQLFLELLDAIDELTVEFSQDYQRFAQGIPPAALKRYGVNEFGGAKRYIKESLRPAAQRWQNEGLTLARTKPWQFSRSIANGQVSLIQILAFVYEQGWRFPEATDPATEAGHRQVFEKSQRYYLKLAVLRSTLNAPEEEAARAKQELDQEINREISIENAKTAAKQADAAGKAFMLGIKLFEALESNRSN